MSGKVFELKELSFKVRNLDSSVKKYNERLVDTWTKAFESGKAGGHSNA